MTRLAALLLLSAAWPGAGHAQVLPSFDCRYASTETELTICGSPALAELELQMFAAYQSLAARIGEREARRIADDLLVRRQACGRDQSCIAERLLISMEVFDQRARSATTRASNETAGSTEPRPTSEGAITERSRPSLIPPIRPEREIDLPAEVANSRILEPDTGGSDRPSLERAPSSDEIEAAIEDAQLTSSDEAPKLEGMAPFDTPLSWAFMDLSREERSHLQVNLTEAGFLQGPADGTWTEATVAAIEAFLATPQADGFDPDTETGAALVLDYIGSDAFAQAFEEGGDANPIASTEW
ncbi:hypothetical protein [Rubellimicrobium arenae]|uniref:hypothetical protein n=1 Tax=Rubellimicrobium arenae TaxID=2817372 RepID=UPI001B313E38|nr:hypothetical protein [Rubellimicrobium arenae]